MRSVTFTAALSPSVGLSVHWSTKLSLPYSNRNFVFMTLQFAMEECLRWCEHVNA